MSKFVEELLARVSLATLIGQRLTWDSRKSRPSSGDYWACCPFHEEKTPSFHVDDHKGVYYCFGCQESGNAITFVRKSDNLEFREAVQALADSVGMQVPASEWKHAAREDSHKSLYDICEQAARHFQIALKSRAGAAARRYLAERGVSDASVKRFEIGFAANTGNGLTQSFINSGITLDSLREAGLSALPDDGRPAYDRFRNRIIFPIRDLRGRMAGFGGRSLDKTAQAKYLNSPETPIFKKGACLYNHRPAREAVKDSPAVVVAEGYMDVIALTQAGIKACVAPLGTAVTESQIRHLWKLSPEPVMAFDGDRAGLNAAQRAARQALPLLTPGHSLRFCFLPNGEDPDDFVRRHGGQAMRDLITKAVPLASFVWQTELERRSLETPEGCAAFEAAVRAAAASIRDQTVRRQYDQFIRRSLFETVRRPSWQQGGGQPRRRGITGPSSELRSSLLVSGSRAEGIDAFIRESAILGICLKVPEILGRCPERLEGLMFKNPANRQLLDCIVSGIGSAEREPGAFRDMVRERYGAQTVDRLLESQRLLPLAAVGASDDDGAGLVDRAEIMLIEEIEKIEAANAAQRELEEAVQDAREGGGGNPLKRVGEAVKTRQQADRGIQPSKASGFVVGENGVLMDPKELEAFDRLLDGMDD